MKAQENALDRLKGHQSGRIRGVQKLTKNSNAAEKDQHPKRRVTEQMDTTTQEPFEKEVRTFFPAGHILAKRFPEIHVRQEMKAKIREKIRDARGSSTSNDRGHPPLSSGLGGQPSASGGSG